jgi:hypothetical protein
MMEAARTSETMVNFCQTTRRYNPEDSHLPTFLSSFLFGRVVDSSVMKVISANYE